MIMHRNNISEMFFLFQQEEEQRLRKEYSVLEDKMEQASSKEKQHKNTQLELQNMRARVGGTSRTCINGVYFTLAVI